MSRFKGLKTISLLYLLIIVSLSIGTSWALMDTFEKSSSNPDVSIYIAADKSKGGPLFDSSQDKWYPGRTERKVLRIHNDRSRSVKVDNISLRIDIKQKYGEEYLPVTGGSIFDAYVQNMDILIKRGEIPDFNESIYDGHFQNMLSEEGEDEQQGYDIPKDSQWNIEKGDYTDLECVIRMNENAGNELQDIKADVILMVNVYEDAAPHRPSRKKSSSPIVVTPNIPDIADHWAHECIQALLMHGIIQGYPDGTIRPDNYITRAEIAVLTGKSLGLSQQYGNTGYVDHVPQWAIGYVNVVTNNSIFQGYPGKTFGADRNITREEFAVTMSKAFKLQEKQGFTLEFEDNQNISEWAVQYVKCVASNNVVIGYEDKTFRPTRPITRAEVFTILCRLLQYHAEHTGVASW